MSPRNPLLHQARQIKRARLYCGMTQAQVARALGLHRPAVSEIEAGRRDISLREAVAIARLLHISLDTLTAGYAERQHRHTGNRAAVRDPARRVRR